MLARTLPPSLPSLHREPPDLELGVRGASATAHRTTHDADQLRVCLPRPIQRGYVTDGSRVMDHDGRGRDLSRKFGWFAGAALITTGVVMLGVGLRNGIPHPKSVFEPFNRNDPRCQPTSQNSDAFCNGQYVGTTSEDVNLSLTITGGVLLGCGAVFIVLDKLCWIGERV